MLGTTYVGTEMLAIGLFTVCLSKFSQFETCFLSCLVLLFILK